MLGEGNSLLPGRPRGHSPAQDPSWGAACGQSEVGEPPEGSVTTTGCRWLSARLAPEGLLSAQIRGLSWVLSLSSASEPRELSEDPLGF